MTMFKKKILRKWRKIGFRALSHDHFQYWDLLGSGQEEESSDIPRDVPKGHLVVYVGEEQKRFVIRVAFLHHPLFRALLDRAQEVYEFNYSNSKLCIPCDESIFLAVLRCVGSQKDQRIWLCF